MKGSVAAGRRKPYVCRRRKEKVSALNEYVRTFVEQINGPHCHIVKELLTSRNVEEPPEVTPRTWPMLDHLDNFSSTADYADIHGISFDNHGTLTASTDCIPTMIQAPTEILLSPWAHQRRYIPRSGRYPAQSAQQAWLMIVERLRGEVIRARDIHRVDALLNVSNSRRKSQGSTSAHQTIESASISYCNICKANPQRKAFAVTICGHFLCWACLCKWHQNDNIAPSKKECPCCKKFLAKNQVTFIGEKSEYSHSGDRTTSPSVEDRLVSTMSFPPATGSFSPQPAFQQPRTTPQSRQALGSSWTSEQAAHATGSLENTALKHLSCSVPNQGGCSTTHPNDRVSPTATAPWFKVLSSDDESFSAGILEQISADATLLTEPDEASTAAISAYVHKLTEISADESFFGSAITDELRQLQENIKNRLASKNPIQSIWLATFLASMGMAWQDLPTSEPPSETIDSQVDISANGPSASQDPPWHNSNIDVLGQDMCNWMVRGRPPLQVSSLEQEGRCMPMGASKLKMDRCFADNSGEPASFDWSSLSSPPVTANGRDMPAFADRFAITNTESHSDLDSVFDETWDWSLHGGVFTL